MSALLGWRWGKPLALNLIFSPLFLFNNYLRTMFGVSSPKAIVPIGALNRRLLAFA
jgi:hypothetical protein